MLVSFIMSKDVDLDELKQFVESYFTDKDFGYLDDMKRSSLQCQSWMYELSFWSGRKRFGMAVCDFER